MVSLRSVLSVEQGLGAKSYELLIFHGDHGCNSCHKARTTIIVAMLLSVLLFSVLLLVWFCLLSLHDYRGGANSLLQGTADLQQRTEPMVLKRAPRVPSSTRARYGDD